MMVKTMKSVMKMVMVKTVIKTVVKSVMKVVVKSMMKSVMKTIVKTEMKTVVKTVAPLMHLESTFPQLTTSRTFTQSVVQKTRLVYSSITNKIYREMVQLNGTQRC